MLYLIKLIDFSLCILCILLVAGLNEYESVIDAFLINAEDFFVLIKIVNVFKN